MVRHRSAFSAQQSLSAVTVFKRFVLGSSLAWILLGALLFLIFFNLRVVDNLKPISFGFNHGTLTVLKSLFAVTILNAICGAVIALPAAAAAVTSLQKLDHLERYTLHKPVFKIFIFQILPWILYFFVASLFILFGLAVAPQFVRSHASEGTLSNTTMALHETLFNRSKKFEIGQISTPQTVIFQLPASILMKPGSLPKLQQALGEPVPFILDIQSYPTQILQMLRGKSESSSNDVSPFYETSAAAASDIKKAAQDLIESSSLKSVKLLTGPEYLFLSKGLDSGSPLHVNEFIWKRVLLSQPQLFLLYRANLLTLWGREFKWKKLVSEDAQTVSDFMQELKQQTTPGLFFIQLNEMDIFNDRIKHPLSGLKWPKMNEKQVVPFYARLDKLLSGVVSQLLTSEQVNILIVPYPDVIPVPLYSYMYTSERQLVNQKTTFLSHTLRDHFLLKQSAEKDECFPALVNSQNKKQVVDLYFKRWSYLASTDGKNLGFVGAKYLQNLIGRDFVGICFADATYILRWNKRLGDKSSFRHWLFNKKDSSSKNEKKRTVKANSDDPEKAKIQSALDMVSIYKLDNITETEEATLLNKEQADAVIERITPQKVLSTMEASTDFLIN